MIKVSIVIPVYNMEKYLERCMKSVLAQTLKEIEIILVDDGSKDSSGSMCDKYAGSQENIRVIHKENGGLTSAWKAGTKASRGEYVGYLDSDDFIQADMFEKMYVKAIEENADIACCGLRHIYEDKDHEEWNEQMEFPKQVFEVSDLQDEMFPALINDGSFMGRRLQPNRVTKIVRRELILANLDNCHDEVSIGEDFQFSLCVFLEAKRIVILKDFFPYYYYMNSSSMTMKYDADYLGKIKIMKKNLIRISDQKKIYDLRTQIISDFLCLVVLHIKGGIVKKKQVNYAEHRRDMQVILRDMDVKEALVQYDMPKLGFAEKLFLFFMKRRWYFAIYAVVRIYFRP